MLLKEAIRSTPGMRFVVERLPLRSSVARHVLYDVEMMSERALAEPINDKDFPSLERLRDIRGTLTALKNGGVLDDIGLFEVKNLALLATDILGPALEPVVQILDPEGRRIPHFYIYDAYSEALKGEHDPERRGEVEDQIRVKLCQKLRPYTTPLHDALLALAWIDIRIAKAKLSKELGFCTPKIGSEWDFQGLFNPEIASVTEFHPLDLSFGTTPAVLTGANMSGKSVLLKTVALAQTLFQFGFGVPAKSATLRPVERIYLCSGDGENLRLSSFAAEMLAINEILQQVHQNAPILALIDEPARTTNPEEGQALVSALVEILSQNHVPSIIATHYSGIPGGRHLRTLDGYTLVETTSTDVPREAISTARTLGIDPEWLDTAEQQLKR